MLVNNVVCERVFCMDNDNLTTSKRISKKTLTIIAVLLLLAGLIVYIFTFSDSAKLKKVESIMKSSRYNEALEYVDKHYSGNKRTEMKTYVSECKDFLVSNKSDLEVAKKDYEDFMFQQALKEDAKRKTDVSQLKIMNQEYHQDGNYIYAKITVKNNSDLTLQYVKTDIFAFESINSKNPIDSYWTNSDSTVPPNGSVVLDKMIPVNSNNKAFDAKISECRFK